MQIFLKTILTLSCWYSLDSSHRLPSDMVLPSTASRVPFWTPKPLKRTPQDTQIFSCGISKNCNLKLIIEFFHLLMTLLNDIMPYFWWIYTHVYGWNMSILWSPLKIWTPKNSTTANFRHPVSKSWLRHCPQMSTHVPGLQPFFYFFFMILYWPNKPL